MPRHRTSEKRRPVEDGVPSGSGTKIPGSIFSYLHTFFGTAAFVLALLVACYTQFHKVVRNQYYGYPDEWFPSVSAATGDRYPARSVFQILIAVTAAPRFAILGLWYLHAASKMRYPSTLAKSIFGIGLVLTSTDDHDIHDIGMLLYILCTFPYMAGTIWYERRLSGVPVQQAVKWRKRLASLFVISLALFEWSLIFYDIGFDACSAYCFNRLQILVVDAGRASERRTSPTSMMGTSLVNAGINSVKRIAYINGWLSTITPLESIYFGADVYLSYIFWSLLTAVPLAIWYFPLWHMGLSGDELYLFANMACNYRGVVHLVTVLTLTAYQFPAPEHRLYLTAAGSFLACVAWFSSFSGRNSDRDVYAWLLGLIASCQWGYNLVGLVLGVVASIIAIYRDLRPSSTHVRPISPDVKITTTPVEKPTRLGWLPSIKMGGRWIPASRRSTVPWGILTILAMCGGLGLAQHRLTLQSSWLAFGLGFAVFLFSIAPNLLLTLGAQPLGRSLATSLLLYNVLLLAHVWTVAYEFVPGGPLLRERTWIVMTVMALTLKSGFLSARSHPHTSLYTSEKQHPQMQHAYEHRRRVTRAMSQLTCAALCILVYWPTPFTAGIWTIHFGIDNDMWASEERMRAAIDELGIDVIGLLESDLQRVITGNRDLTQSLGEILNMYTDYGPASSKHTWGCTMLSKFPIKRSSHHYYPRRMVNWHAPSTPHRCTRTDVDVIISHNGQDENLLDRRLQTTELARIASASKNPIVFLGYVVSKPFGEIYNILMGEGKLNDVDPTDWDRWCEYIGFRGLKRIGYARVSHGNLAAGEGNRVPLGNYIDESTLPKALHYPSQFRNQGVRGHRYHVFDEPRYFDY
ncbi:Frag1/DRAM/Sfk1 family-domain-containing protein [Syncephalis plumigaleata]|nr:Frag1/DRAM/Sfk1 family-domain-containing protein [Syncephalis plumigaleata]